MNSSHRGTTLTELIVAMMLLGTAMSVIGTAMPRLARQRALTSQRQVAMQELSNQLERLTSLNANELGGAVDRMELSDEIRALLPDAKLTGQLIRDDPRLGTGAVGVRVQITWKAWWGETAPPLALETWIYPERT